MISELFESKTCIFLMRHTINMIPNLSDSALIIYILITSGGPMNYYQHRRHIRSSKATDTHISTD